MGIHSPDPYQCHVVAVMLCQIRVIRFRLQPDPIYRLFGDRLYDFAVFDGMGGAAYGEIASEIAVQTMKKYERRLKNAEEMRAVDQIVTEFVTEANNSICDMLREKNCLSGGTTFAMLYFIDGLAKLYYLGDSRIYMQDEEDLICLTRDHTLANQK